MSFIVLLASLVSSYRTDMANWSKEDTLRLIEKYRSLECLWRVKSKDYCNKYLKEKAYESLLCEVRTFDPEASKVTIARKINSIRSSFRREMKKIAASQTSGSSPDQPYFTQLWYFDELSFLVDQEVPRHSISNIIESQEELDETSTSSQVKLEVEVDTPVTEEYAEFSSPEIESSTASPPTRTTNYCVTPTPRPTVTAKVHRRRPPKRKPADDELMTLVRQRLTNPPPVEDQFTAFGKNIEHKMRNLARDQRIHAEKLITDVLYEAELGNLNREYNLSKHTHVIASRQPQDIL